ncbi:ethanolamine utilization protein, partial [Salmonella enterica subsp. enterica serovar Derby]
VAVGDAALVEAPADAGKRKTTARRKAKKTTSPRKKSR